MYTMHGSFALSHGWWMLFVAVLLVVPFWRLCTRAGFAGPLSLLILVPLANIGLIYFLAFADWPAHRRAEH